MTKRHIEVGQAPKRLGVPFCFASKNMLNFWDKWTNNLDFGAGVWYNLRKCRSCDARRKDEFAEFFCR